MRLAYLALAAVLAPSIAAACPAPPPDMENYHCAKYDHMRDNYVKEVPPPPQIYARAGRAKFPRSKKRLMRLLTSAVWHGKGDRVQFLDGSNIPDVIDLADGAHSEIVRTIDATDDGWQVSTDDRVYQLHPCKIGHRATVCLTS